MMKENRSSDGRWMLALALALAVMMAAGSAQAQNLLTDGGFEVGVVVAGGFEQLQPGDSLGA